MDCAGQSGVALLEVLIAAIVVGVGVLGVSLMLVYGPAFTTSQGTNQAELYFVEQKFERLRVLGYVGVPALGPTDTGATAGCSSDAEPCYSETIQGGAVTGGREHSFTRLTCVDYVSDSGPPYPDTCPGPAPAQPKCPWGGASDLTCTKRVRVTVQPIDQAPVARPDTIVLEMLLVNPPPYAYYP